MHYLLDTNIVIAAVKGVPSVRTRLEQVLAADVVLSPVVLGELQFGIEKSSYPERNRAKLEKLIDGFAVVPLDVASSRTYGLIRNELERVGQPIGANDLWIAAQAMALGATMVTDNTREFERIAGLQVENWLSP
jgi:tRNA(fMet)-specific endonuclease VapC